MKPTIPITILVLILAGLLAACSGSGAPDNGPQPEQAPPPLAESEATPTATALPTPPPVLGQLIFSAENGGRWDLNAVAAVGGPWQLLTADGTARAPSVTRDGARLAFQSHRDGNWEIYIQDAAARTTRLTRTPAFDGQPSWAPDGSYLAFASTRQGDLDIWVMKTDGSAAVDLTADSSAVDYGPAWSPDGRWIAFTSWRTGIAQVFVVSVDGKQTLNLSQNKFDDQSPAWSPDGKQIAFVSDRSGQRAIHIADFKSGALQNARRLTYSGRDDSPVWSPDGRNIAFVSPRPTRSPAYVIPASGGIPRAISSDPINVQSVAWANVPAPFKGIDRVPVPAPLYAAPSPGSAASLVALKQIYLAPSYGRISDRVSASYLALRDRVRAEAGWDFLGTLADMTRQLTGECGDGCTVLSWHKAGRAVDTRLEVESGGMTLLEIIREDELGETYWRLYLRAGKQDGTMGEPLTEPPWDMSNTARWTLAPHQGGVPKTIPNGYYVDMTELAHAYGWYRISSYDDEDLSWKENKMGMEFWHYQMTEGLTWYPALRELYSDETLAGTFDWNALIRSKEDPYLLRIKGVPAPPAAWRWFTLYP